MAMTPKNILLRLGYTLPNDNKSCTMKELRRAFLNAGYGPNKASKWINAYAQEGIIKDLNERNDNGELLFTCDWWVSYV